MSGFTAAGFDAVVKGDVVKSDADFLQSIQDKYGVKVNEVDTGPFVEALADTQDTVAGELGVEERRPAGVLSGDRDGGGQEHRERGADVSIAVKPVSRQEAPALGILQADEQGQIVDFQEKPQAAVDLDRLRLLEQPGGNPDELYLASMGIYIFKRATLTELLDNEMTDFGKHIIPRAIETHRVFSHVYQGYWEDIGTIRSFFEANLDMVSTVPKFDFFQMETPIYTRPRFMPASKINGAAIDQAVISDGCIIDRSRISQSLIGVRCLISPGCRVHRSVLMGSDFYETNASKDESDEKGIPRIGVGENTRIEQAIIDKNARIGANCVITPDDKPEHFDGENYYIREGIVIIPKNAVIQDDTVI